MILYAHRGNTNGRVLGMENNPAYIEEAIQKGFHVEIDLRTVNGQKMLGHDFPAHPVSLSWLRVHKDNLLIHAKDFKTACDLRVHGDFTFFCHNSDPFALISNGLIWLHDLSYAGPFKGRYVLPLISLELVNTCPKHPVCAGICSDFVAALKTVGAHVRD